MPELVDLETIQIERDKIIAQFDAKVAEIQADIDSLQVEIATVEGQISLSSAEVENLETQVSIWQQRKKAANFLYDSLVRNYKWEVDQACQEFNLAWSGYAEVQRVTKGYLGQWGALLDYVNIWMPPATSVQKYARSIEVKDILVKEANQQLAIAQRNQTEARTALSSAQNSLEAKTRHMRDLQLAKEACQEEQRGALALWEAERQATLERKRIEISSITRDVALDYPEMDAETAESISKMAYEEAILRGFTRLEEAIEMATDLTTEWQEKPVIPHYTSKAIFCPSCGIKLDITFSDVAADNRQLTCPQCGASVGIGIQVVKRIELKPAPPLALGVSIPRAWEWVKKNAPWIGVGTAVFVLVLVLASPKKVSR